MASELGMAFRPDVIQKDLLMVKVLTLLSHLTLLYIYNGEEKTSKEILHHQLSASHTGLPVTCFHYGLNDDDLTCQSYAFRFIYESLQMSSDVT